MNTDLLTAIGVILTFLIGIFNFVYSIKNNKKTLYINAITAERIKWITKVRDCIAEFYTSIEYYAKDREDVINEINKTNLIRMKLKLYLNPEDDADILKLIDDLNRLLYESRRYALEGIPTPEMHKISLTPEIVLGLEQLVNESQELLKTEWERVKIESIQGSVRFNNRKEIKKRRICEFIDEADDIDIQYNPLDRQVVINAKYNGNSDEHNK